MYGVDWTQTQYRDLWKPLYSGIAARLKISMYYRDNNIPQSVAEQADYWARRYTTKTQPDAADYVNANAGVDTSKY